MSSLWVARDYCDTDVIFTVSDLICSERNIDLFMRAPFADKILVDGDPKYFSDPDPVKVVINDGHIRTVLKDVPENNVSGVAIGIYKLSKEKISQLIDEIRVYMESDCFDFALYYAIDKLSRKVEINPVFCEESFWFDIDTAKELKKAEEDLEKGLRKE
jgi:choline kinase